MNRRNVSIAKHLPLVLMLIAAIPASAQIPAAGQLTDAQAAAMMQALAAQAQGAAETAMTQAQVQALLLYMMRQAPASSSAASAAQAQMLMQAMAQTSSAAPSAAVSAAQAQALAKMFASQPAAPTAMPPALARTSPVPVPTMTTAQQTPAKKPGAIRIGVVTPKAQMGGSGQGANNVPEAVRALIVQYLSGPVLEVTPIVAMAPQQIEAELKQKECDFVLYSAMSQKMNSGGLGLLKKAMPMASMIPMVGLAGGLAGVAAGATASTAAGAASVANTVKAKSEVTFEYKLLATGSGESVIANSCTAKAKSDGEDIVTPLIAQADNAILTAITKSK